jgi:hypothetical protein
MDRITIHTNPGLDGANRTRPKSVLMPTLRVWYVWLTGEVG